MSNDQRARPDESSTDNLPVEYRAPTDLDAMLAVTQGYVAAGQQWLEGRTFWYDSTLEGIPFVLTSEPRWSTKPAATVQGERNGQAVQYQIPAQECVQFTIRRANLGEHRFYDPELASFTGRYLVNQVRDKTLNELLSSVWTVARRPGDKFGTPSGQARMLKRFDPATDIAPDESTDFSYVPAKQNGSYPANVVEVPLHSVPSTGTSTVAVGLQSQVHTVMGFAEFIKGLRERHLTLQEAAVLLDLKDGTSFAGREYAADIAEIDKQLGEMGELDGGTPFPWETESGEGPAKRRGRPRKS